MCETHSSLFQIIVGLQDGEGLQQLHVQEILPSLFEGQSKTSLASPEKARGWTSCSGGSSQLLTLGIMFLMFLSHFRLTWGLSMTRSRSCTRTSLCSARRARTSWRSTSCMSHLQVKSFKYDRVDLQMTLYVIHIRCEEDQCQSRWWWRRAWVQVWMAGKFLINHEKWKVQRI